MLTKLPIRPVAEGSAAAEARQQYAAASGGEQHAADRDAALVNGNLVRAIQAQGRYLGLGSLDYRRLGLIAAYANNEPGERMQAPIHPSNPGRVALREEILRNMWPDLDAPGLPSCIVADAANGGLYGALRREREAAISSDNGSTVAAISRVLHAASQAADEQHNRGAVERVGSAVVGQDGQMTVWTADTSDSGGLAQRPAGPANWRTLAALYAANYTITSELALL